MMHVPLTLEAYDKCPQWQASPVWPLPLAATSNFMLRIMTALDEASRSLQQPDADIVALASLRISSAAGAYGEAAMLCEAAARQNLEIESSIPAVAWLLGKSDTLPWRAPSPAPAGRDRSSLVRRLARTLTLNSPAGAPAALVRPRHTAVTHNHLLTNVARRSPDAVSFRHAQSFLDSAPPHANPPAPDPTLVNRLAEMLCSAAAVRDPFATRLHSVIIQIVRTCLVLAASDMNALLANPASLPRSIWCGTGAHYPTRALALAVRGQGGEVTAFDHGGCSGMFEWEMLRFTEFRTATRFVTSTPDSARLVQQTRSYVSLPETSRPSIIAHDGDPTFADASRIVAATPRTKPRVMYVLGPYYGFRQWYPPLYPDAVYQHLLFSITAALARLPVNLVCRPRPSAGRRHPVESIAACDYRPFHTALGDADVLVFDDVHSTAFWEALCTNRRVVLIDLGYNRFVPEVDTIVRRRVRFVSAIKGSDNVPVLDGPGLRDAVLAPTGTIDPTEIHRLLAASATRSKAIQPQPVFSRMALPSAAGEAVQ